MLVGALAIRAVHGAMRQCPITNQGVCMLRKRQLFWVGVGLLAGLAHAEEKPRWELGLGLVGVSVPDYRGSDERSHYVLPTPYLVYRGDVLKADREGARAQLLGLDTVHLDFNVGISPPVSGLRNQARAGMPGLAGALELGPALDVELYQSADERTKVRFRLPLSYGLPLGGEVGSNGWQSAPHVALHLRDVLGQSGWGFALRGGPMYASHDRHAYYYDVAQRYATATRPEYHAGGGYSGMQFTTLLAKRYDTFWVGAFARYDNLNGAAFTHSPLVKTRNYLVGGLAVAWVLGQSSEMVKID
jgi:outer membrane protein